MGILNEAWEANGHDLKVFAVMPGRITILLQLAQVDCLRFKHRDWIQHLEADAVLFDHACGRQILLIEALYRGQNLDRQWSSIVRRGKQRSGAHIAKLP